MPHLWKQSTIVPFAKSEHPTSINDFRPIALTSLVMKSFEKLIKAELLKATEHLIDPLQFAYRSKRGVQDATITLLNYIYKHLESSSNHVRLMFVDFSAAFQYYSATSTNPETDEHLRAGGQYCWLDFGFPDMQNTESESKWSIL